MLLFFLLAGRVLDAMMRDRARAGIEALLRSSRLPARWCWTGSARHAG
jgi:cation transport ATPase